MLKTYVLSFLMIVGTTSFAAPFTTENLYQQLIKANPQTREQVLQALPQEMKDNFVLIRDSRSRQRGTPELPRVIHFSKSADLVVSSSGHSAQEDRAANDLEVMEFDRANARWRFATISFGGGVQPPKYNLRMCIGCHGDNPRPIWGPYHSWNDSYGGDESQVDKMLPNELIQFRAFASKAKTHEAYKHLNLVETDEGFILPNTTYGLPNTVLTARLGVRHAQILFERIKRAPLYPQLRGLLLHQIRSCRDQSVVNEIEVLYKNRIANDPNFAAAWNQLPALRSTTQALRLLDLDTSSDLRVETFPRAGYDDEASLLYWNAGTDYIGSLLGFLILHELENEKPEIAAQFVSVKETIERIWKTAFESSNEDLMKIDQSGVRGAYLQTLFPYAFQSVMTPVENEKGADVICSLFKN